MVKGSSVPVELAGVASQEPINMELLANIIYFLAWIIEWELLISVDWIKGWIQNSKNVTKYSKHLKKSGCNVVWRERMEIAHLCTG